MAAINYKPAHDATVTLGGTTYKCTTASIGVAIEKFDTTNTESNGAEEFGIGVKSHSIQFELPVNDDTPAIPAEGSFITCSWADGANTYTGDAAIMNISRRGGGRGGFTVSGTAEFTGAVTKS